MNKKIAQFFFLFVCCFPLAKAQGVYTMQDLVREYIDMTVDRFTFFDFRDQQGAQEILRVHNVWEYERNFWVYTPLQIPRTEAEKGILYQSGVYYDIYQSHLYQSYETLVDIHTELEGALDKACEICVKKQKIDLQICPQRCLSPGVGVQ